METSNRLDMKIHTALQRGLVIPACPLALDGERRFDERRQRALLRDYSAAGAWWNCDRRTYDAIRHPRTAA